MIGRIERKIGEWSKNIGFDYYAVCSIPPDHFVYSKGIPSRHMRLIPLSQACLNVVFWAD
jgi:hypothetical protein